MKKNHLFVFILLIITGCNSSKKIYKPSPSQNFETKKEDTLTKCEQSEYRFTATRNIDIIHTILEVSFDWEKQYLFGKATLTLKPYFYPQKEITLDAKGFEIKILVEYSLSNLLEVIAAMIVTGECLFEMSF